MLHIKLFPEFLRGHTWGRKSVFIYIWIFAASAWTGITLLASFLLSETTHLNILLELLLFTTTTDSSRLLRQTLTSITLQNDRLAAASKLEGFFPTQLIAVALISWFEWKLVFIQLLGMQVSDCRFVCKRQSHFKLQTQSNLCLSFTQIFCKCNFIGSNERCNSYCWAVITQTNMVF